MNDGEMVVYLHNLARETNNNILRNIADRLDELKPYSSGVVIDRSEEARKAFREYYKS